MVAKGMAMVSRQGRELQRYTSSGGRIVVGCVPYRINEKYSSSDDIEKTVEILVISSQKGHGMMFPKGGWETDETIKQAASREALEEAGVQGKLERRLGKWSYKSKSHGIFYDGILFPLIVTDELTRWPEMQARKRTWVTAADAREGCQHEWMVEALDRLIRRLEFSNFHQRRINHLLKPLKRK
ncbi:hypothetical protein LUZ60_004681 [Juncus effusus]|nr:hypothetical protein LUZ60_004681 [Juncus effusus]